MSKGKLYIKKDEYNFEIFNEGIRLQSSQSDVAIKNLDMYSIRYISLLKIEIFIYILLSIVSFTLWWVIGLILTIYTIIQVLMNYRVIFITSKGQFILKFNNLIDKYNFINSLKQTNPNIFKISKWFNFKKDKR